MSIMNNIFKSVKKAQLTIVLLLAVISQIVQAQNLTISQLIKNPHIITHSPIIIGDTALFIFKGDSLTRKVSWAGDFNGWNPKENGWQGWAIKNTHFWYLAKRFPSNARFDYKIVVDDQWIKDPLNDAVQLSGWDYNSVIAMKDYLFPEETKVRPEVDYGSLSMPITISSTKENLGYNVKYQVWTPPQYSIDKLYPAIYVLDGQDYVDQEKGAFITIIGNLIHDKKVAPAIVIFIDPRNPNNSQENRRMSEYAANPKFTGFLCDELVPFIDKTYATLTNPQSRALCGTSMGGWCCAFTGIERPDVFGKLILHSPAFNQNLINLYQESPVKEVSIWITTGTFFDTQERALKLKNILQSKGYKYSYNEANEGHSWGLWRSQIAAPLIYFFGL